MAGVDLELEEDELILKDSFGYYFLRLRLSKKVDEEATKATFDNSQRSLTITLPIRETVTIFISPLTILTFSAST